MVINDEVKGDVEEGKSSTIITSAFRGQEMSNVRRYMFVSIFSTDNSCGENGVRGS